MRAYTAHAEGPICLSCLQANVFSSVSTLRLLGGLLAPYCSMLTYSTRLTEMRRLVNDLIAPIAASLAQQKSSQLAKLGCTVEEAPPGAVPVDGKGICVAVGSQGRSSSNKTVQAAAVNGSSSSGSTEAVTQPVPVASISNSGSSGSLRQRKGSSSKGSSTAAGSSGKSSSKAAGASTAGTVTLTGITTKQVESQAVSHKRFESGACKPQQHGSTCQTVVAPAVCAQSLQLLATR